MLSFRMAFGDDLFIGIRGEPLEGYKEVILHRDNGNGVVTVLTKDEAIDIPLSPVAYPEFHPIGVHGVEISCAHNEYSGGCLVGFNLANNVAVLRGRIYRRECSE